MLNWEGSENLKKSQRVRAKRFETNINETCLARDILTIWHMTISMQSKRLAFRQCQFLQYLKNACLAKLGGFLTGLYILNIL